MNTIRLILVLTSLILFQSCSDSRWNADISDVDYSGEIHRLDVAMFSLGENMNQENLAGLKGEYGSFLNSYLKQIMQVGEAENAMTASLFQRFVTDPNWKELQRIIEEKHPNLDKQSAELENAFKRYAVLFQDTKLPILVAYNSGFNVGIYPEQDFLGIGVEWYSGNDLDIFNRLPPDLFPQYKRDKMMPEFMTINALKGWLFVKYQDKLNGESLLNRMSYSGKINYIAAALHQNLSDEVVLNYTEEQIDWCDNQEYEVWKFILEQDLIFSEEAMAVNKMMNDGPFTPGMPPESPGGVGNYIGYEMIKAFMDKNDNITLPQLLNMKNDRELLKYYKPGR